MLLLDVNVWVTAFLEPDDRATALRTWIEELLDGPEGVVVTETLLVSVVRVSTQISSASVEQALSFVAAVRQAPACHIVEAGPKFWPIFCDILTRSRVTGRTITDAALAAHAIELDCTLVSFDSDFKRLAGSRWMSPPI